MIAPALLAAPAFLFLRQATTKMIALLQEGRWWFF